MNTRISFLCVAALLVAAPVIRAGGPTITVWAGEEDKESKAEKEQDLYDEGNDALDDHDWARAVRYFDRVAKMKMSHADAALYYKALAQSNGGSRADALSTILELRQWYPKSKWNDEANALEIEIRRDSGQKIEPRHVEDEELKLMALSALMQSDPDRAIPIIEGILNGNQSSKMKEKALFVLSQSSSPKGMDVLARIAKNGPRDLQSRAIRFLGIAGGSRARDVLADVYNSSASVDAKKAVLKAYMISGDRTHLFALAKGEPNPELRMEAISQLGLVGARDELSQLYSAEQNVEVKKKIIQGMFLGGSADKLNEIATTERNQELKLTAIRNMGLIGGGRTGQMLVSIYENDSRKEVREAVINSLFIQNNAKALVDLARKEKDPDLKHSIVQKLSLMGHSKEALDYLMEFLK